MYKFNALSAIETFYADCGFVKESKDYGIRFHLDNDEGKGYCDLIGDPDTAYFVTSEVDYYKETCIRQILHERYIELCFSKSPDGAPLKGTTNVLVYKHKDQPEVSEHGLNCYVNLSPKQYFLRIKPGTHLSCHTVVLRQEFFDRNHLKMPDNFWYDAAALLGTASVSLPKILPLFEQIARSTYTGLTQATFMKAKFIEIAALLYAHIEENAKTPAPLKPNHEKIVLEAAAYLQCHYTEPPSVRHLAQLLSTNPNKLQAGFKQMKGMTCYQYIGHLRMEKAMDLLSGTGLTMEEIAIQLGYHSKINFYNNFKQTYGITPKKMRLLLKEA